MDDAVTEVPGAAVEEDRNKVDEDLVDQPASMYCRPIAAPPMLTFFSPAIAWARLRPDAMPSANV